MNGRSPKKTTAPTATALEEEDIGSIFDSDPIEVEFRPASPPQKATAFVDESELDWADRPFAEDEIYTVPEKSTSKKPTAPRTRQKRGRKSSGVSLAQISERFQGFPVSTVLVLMMSGYIHFGVPTNSISKAFSAIGFAVSGVMVRGSIERGSDQQ